MKRKPRTGDLITTDYKDWHQADIPIRTDPETWEEELNNFFENQGFSVDCYFIQPNGKPVRIKKGEEV
jgi:hypothetical protein